MTPLKQKLFIYLIASIAALGGILFGYDTGVISGALIFIQKEFHLSLFQQEMVVSAVLLGALLGSIGSGKMTDYYGRHRALTIAAAGFVLGTILSTLATQISFLILGRLIIGFAIGVASFTVPLYLSEIAPTKIRGAIVLLNTITVTGGIVVAYWVNYAFTATENWRAMFGVGILPAVLLAIGAAFLPRSPRWLVQIGEDAQAQKTLEKIRPPHQVHAELSAIRRVLAQSATSYRELFKPQVRAVLWVGIGLAIIQQISGINTILYYAPTIFNYAGFHGATAQILATLGMGLTNFIFTIVALCLVDLVGRRTLLIIGLTGMTLSLFVVATCFFLGINTAQLQWLAAAGLTTFVATYALSCGCIFWLIISEIYPLSIRGMAMSIATTANWTSNMLVALTFLSLIHATSPGVTFLLYACANFASLLFCYFLVPETKGVSLETIEENLKAGRFVRNIGA